MRQKIGRRPQTQLCGDALEQVDIPVGNLLLLGPGQLLEHAPLGLQRQDDILPDRQVADDALGLAVVGQHRKQYISFCPIRQELYGSDLTFGHLYNTNIRAD